MADANNVASVRRAVSRGGAEARRRGACLLWSLLALALAHTPGARADATRPIDLVLVLDGSASMSQNDPRRAVLTSAATLVERLGPDDGAGLVLFGDTADAPVPLAPLAESDHRESLLKAIAGVRYEKRLSDLGAGVERGLYELRARGRPGSGLAMVFFTDGIVDTGSQATDAQRTAWLTTDLLEDAKRRGVRIFAVAFGEQADYLLIQRMAASTGGEYYRAADAAEVGRVFEAIAASLDDPAPAAAATAAEADPPAPADTRSLPFSPWVVLVLAGGLGLAGLAVLAVARRRSRGVPAPAPADDPAVPLAPAALVAVKTGERIPIDKPTFTVGRDEHNDVVLDSDLVSFTHARIEFRDRHYVVVDLRSTNGTAVNGRRIDAPTVLKDGDLVDFDEFRYRFVGGTSGASGTVVRMTPVARTNVRLDPIRPEPSPDDEAAREHHEVIETRAGTHKLVLCAVHGDQRAVAHCVRCGKAGCAECVSITDEGPICTDCAASPHPRTLG